jgi:hypothetical protein
MRQHQIPRFWQEKAKNPAQGVGYLDDGTNGCGWKLEGRALWVEANFR